MVSKDEEVGVDIFESARLSANEGSSPTLHRFDEDNYKGEWLFIGRFVSMMTMDAKWTKEEVG